ncbi:hypothetical protein EGW08_004416 [Elysia chlorotica]|uniref:Uncharacterized protein n=1 Tax=Elysia chlorotica TaxID=188477 RepID=A0A3S1HWZ3_ELYCH|nr:hypothetical protein EGW08_004416 [Elysia chlorotica]
MGLEGGSNLMKYALIFLNTLGLIGGGVAIGVGVWSLVADYGSRDLASVTGSKLYEAACILVIVGGGLVALLSLIGCCGACMENRRLLTFYSAGLSIIFILFVTAAVVGFFYKDKLEEKLEEEMTSTLLERYDVDIDTNDENQDVTDVWNKIQSKLKCCGVSGGLTSSTPGTCGNRASGSRAKYNFRKIMSPPLAATLMEVTHLTNVLELIRSTVSHPKQM